MADFAHSMPVGRIGYAYVEPLGFPEFLEAHGQPPLLERLGAWRPGEVLSAAVHEKAAEWFDRYMMTGGMPAVVAADSEGADARACRDIQRDLLHTYQDDFAKYAGRTDSRVLRQVLLTVVASLGSKFVYSSVGDGVKAPVARRSLEMLAAARLCRLIEMKDGAPVAMDCGSLLPLSVTQPAATGRHWHPAARSLPRPPPLTAQPSLKLRRAGRLSRGKLQQAVAVQGLRRT